MNAISIKKENPLQAVAPLSHLDFHLPADYQCAKPTEARGIRRDEVRLMVSNIGTDEVRHTVFKNLGQFLQAGDVLVVNTSGTMKAALEAFRPGGQLVRAHFSTALDDGRWAVEIRQVAGEATKRFDGAEQGETLALKNGGSLTLEAPYYRLQRRGHLKLWVAKVDLGVPLPKYLDNYGKPIKYGYLKGTYPQSYYQTVFAREIGSAEMPSAGRPFTAELVTSLVAKGVQILPILLHTGVASLEVNERPYEEFFKISPSTADAVNLARKRGRRIVAVGTTAVRALESAVGRDGRIHAAKGRTNLFITPQRGLFAVDALLTGFHEPRASHLYMLEALAGRNHLEVAYSAALEEDYQWHEFGDVHLILP